MSASAEAGCDFVELAPQMAPAIRERHRAALSRRCGELFVDGITVDLQHAAEAREQFDRVLAATARRVAIGDSRRRAAARHGGAMLRCVRDVALSGWCKSSS